MNTLYEYKLPGYHLQLLPTALSIDERQVLSMSSTTILLRDIVLVNLRGLNRQVVLSLRDGKQVQLKVFGKDSDALYAALLPLLH